MQVDQLDKLNDPDIKYLQDNPDIVLTHLEIEKLFHNSCVRCRKYSRVVHEIKPKSLDTHWERWSNRVTLCAACHEWAHSRGTKYSGPILIQLRDQRLQEYYG